MRLRLIAVGSRMPKWVEEGWHEYAKRLPSELALDLVEIPLNTRGKNADVARLIRQEGEAMLSVQAADGSEAYTRRGDLAVSPNGVLVNGEGFAVVGEDGPIALAPGSDVSIGPDGAVLVRSRADP